MIFLGNWTFDNLMGFSLRYIRLPNPIDGSFPTIHDHYNYKPKSPFLLPLAIILWLPPKIVLAVRSVGHQDCHSLYRSSWVYSTAGTLRFL